MIDRAKYTTGAILFIIGIVCLILAGMLSGCSNPLNPVDPRQLPCGGEDVYYGEYCCNVNMREWKCPVEAACGWEPGDCRTIEPSDEARGVRR